jgi:hypothetical protein
VSSADTGLVSDEIGFCRSGSHQELQPHTFSSTQSSSSLLIYFFIFIFIFSSASASSSSSSYPRRGTTAFGCSAFWPSWQPLSSRWMYPYTHTHAYAPDAQSEPPPCRGSSTSLTQADTSSFLQVSHTLQSDPYHTCRTSPRLPSSYNPFPPVFPPSAPASSPHTHPIHPTRLNRFSAPPPRFQYSFLPLSSRPRSSRSTRSPTPSAHLPRHRTASNPKLGFPHRSPDLPLAAVGIRPTRSTPEPDLPLRQDQRVSNPSPNQTSIDINASDRTARDRSTRRNYLDTYPLRRRIPGVDLPPRSQRWTR